MDALQYVEKNYDNFVNTLKELLKIPSVSAQSKYKEDVKSCARFLAGQLEGIGLSPKIIETPGHPIVYCQYEDDPHAPTALIYGHYDVQPVDPLNLWKSPPFEPLIDNDIIYARGAADDKGQLLIHLKAVESFMKTQGQVPINFKMVLEGEEEVQSVNLDDFLEKNREMLKSDFAIISDTAMFGPDMPALTYSLRGIAIAEIEVTGPNRDLHSGSYGGAVPNPIHALAQIISACHDEDYRITIPGFYDDVLDIEEWERKAFKDLPFDENKFLKEVGSQGLVGEKGYSSLERRSARPTFEVNGIYGGYDGEGSKTIIPSWAGAKITMRLVPNQDPFKICDLLEKYLHSIKPEGITLRVKTGGGAKPALISKDNPIMQAAAQALKEGFGKDPYFIREGGSIPIVNIFKEVLGIDTILLGFCQPDCNAHSPNEWLALNDFKRGIISTINLYKKLAEMRM